ncbi:MAG: type III pantothenate kinase [Pseudomonadota bacterium]
MSGGKDLLIDLGNTRLKWTRAGSEGLEPSRQLGCDQPLAPALARAWDKLETPRRIAVVSVGARPVRETLNEWIRGRWSCPISHAESAATAQVRAPLEETARFVVNSYADPQQMGADRWIAMLGAASLCRGAFAVVDAGTALTVDVVGDDGQHRGGWILPGRALMHRSLSRGTAAVRPDLIDSDGAFGQDTRTCVAGGVSAAVLGALQLLDRQLPPDCQLLVCGGDGRWLSQHLPRARYEADLVLQGLNMWLQSS